MYKLNILIEQNKYKKTHKVHTYKTKERLEIDVEEWKKNPSYEMVNYSNHGEDVYMNLKKIW